MENPASWSEAEHVVHEARMDWQKGHDAGICGASFEMLVCAALRRAGLLIDSERTQLKTG